MNSRAALLAAQNGQYTVLAYMIAKAWTSAGRFGWKLNDDAAKFIKIAEHDPVIQDLFNRASQNLTDTPSHETELLMPVPILMDRKPTRLLRTGHAAYQRI